MSSLNICLYKEVDKKDTGYILKTIESLDCSLIGVCVIIWTLFLVRTMKSLFQDKKIEIFTCPQSNGTRSQARYFHSPENHTVTEHIKRVDNHQMIITAKYGSYHFSRVIEKSNLTNISL